MGLLLRMMALEDVMVVSGLLFFDFFYLLFSGTLN